MKAFFSLIIISIVLASCAPQISADAITISNVWVRPSAVRDQPTQTNAISGAYAQITNNATMPITLISIEMAGAQSIQLHETEVTNDIAQMHHHETGVAIPAGETLMMQPGGFHIMLMGLTIPLYEGDTIALTFVFDHNIRITIDAPIRQEEP